MICGHCVCFRFEISCCIFKFQVAMHSQLPRFLVYQCIFLSSDADDAHQIYTRGSVIGTALNRNPEISPTPSPIFTGGQKVINLASFSTSLNFERPAFENAARYLKSETNKFCTEFEHMKPERPQKFKVKGSKVKVIA